MEDQFTQIAKMFNEKVNKFGHSFRALDYGSAISQQLKFAVMAEVMPLHGLKILDVGCGFADLYDFLKNKGFDINYTGYDITPAMIATAKEKQKNCRLEVRNILDNPPDEKFDVVLSSGIFYLLQKNQEEIMQALIKRMFDMATKAVAFTTISSWCDDPEEGEFYADPLKTLEFCRTLTPRLTLRHDYHGRDFAIYMYKDIK